MYRVRVETGVAQFTLRMHVYDECWMINRFLLFVDMFHRLLNTNILPFDKNLSIKIENSKITNLVSHCTSGHKKNHDVLHK